MPIYEYEHDEYERDDRCGQCEERFETLQGINDSPLTKCPDCGKACHRVFSTFSTGSSSGDVLSNKNLESHGFTKYERAGKGRYEKKFGEGPGLISGEQG